MVFWVFFDSSNPSNTTSDSSKKWACLDLWMFLEVSRSFQKFPEVSYYVSSGARPLVSRCRAIPIRSQHDQPNNKLTNLLHVLAIELI